MRKLWPGKINICASARPASKRLPVSRANRCVFQRADHRSAYGQDWALLLFRFANFLGRRFRDFVGLRVNLVFFENFGVDGLECPQADFQCDFAGFAAARADSFENLLA